MQDQLAEWLIASVRWIARDRKDEKTSKRHSVEVIIFPLQCVGVEEDCTERLHIPRVKQRTFEWPLAKKPPARDSCPVDQYAALPRDSLIQFENIDLTQVYLLTVPVEVRVLRGEPWEKRMGTDPCGRGLFVRVGNGGHLSVPSYLRVKREFPVAAPLDADLLDDNVPVPNHHRITV